MMIYGVDFSIYSVLVITRPGYKEESCDHLIEQKMIFLHKLQPSEEWVHFDFFTNIYNSNDIRSLNTFQILRRIIMTY
jgi:hypothetical protein